MKKLFSIILVGLISLFTGCNDKEVDIAAKVGKAAGYAANTFLTGETKDVVVEVAKQINNSAVDIITKDIKAAVGDIATNVANEFLDKGLINDKQAKIVTTVGRVLGTGLEYLFKKHPEWKDDLGLSAKVVNAFTDAALSVMTTNPKLLSAPVDGKDYDEEAYKVIQSSL